MNRLYTIKWKLPNGYTISTSNYWSRKEAEEKMRKNSEWKYTIEEENSAHIIWIAR